MTYPKYYISTGELAVYFTLRCISIEYNSRLQAYERDAYVGRLSTDKDKAIAKAKAQLGFVPEIRSAPTNKLTQAKARTPEEIEAASYFMPNGKFCGQDLRDLIAQGEEKYLIWWLNNYRRSEAKALTADKIAIFLFSETLESYNARLEAEANAEAHKVVAEQKAKAREFWPLLARLRNDWQDFSPWEKNFLDSILSRVGLRIPFELKLPDHGLVSFSDYEKAQEARKEEARFSASPVLFDAARPWSSLEDLSDRQLSTLENILGRDLDELLSAQ